MRALALLTLFWLAFLPALRGDDQVVERFDGHNSLTTADFTVPNHWEIRWHSAQVLSVGIIRLDNSVVAGASGLNNGSLYLPHGGTFRLRVKGGDSIPWDVAVVALGPISATAPPDTTDNPEADSFYVPTAGPEEADATNAVPEETEPTPTPIPSPTPTPTPKPTPLPTHLTAAQQQAIVVVKGDRAQGAGFLIQTPAGPVVVTTISLVSDNANLNITTKNGAQIRATNLQGAIDRDLAMIGVEDASDPKLPVATDVANTVRPGDAVLTTAPAATAAAPPDAVAHVFAVGPQRIEIDNLWKHAVPGGPILEAATGKIVGVVSAAAPPLDTNDLDRVPFAARDAEGVHLTKYFGLRLDTVAGWQNYDWKRLSVETAFLSQFHEHSRNLDSYLHAGSIKLWTSDDKIKTANDNFVQDSAGGDTAQRMAALRSLLFDLGVMAYTDMDQIQQPANFYSYDRQRARDEIAYRQALKAELDNFSGNLGGFSDVTRRDNPPTN